MFPTFTGQSRRPRNVNLSGKTRKDQNTGGLRPRLGQPSTAPGAQSSVLNAQQERERRNAEKKKLQAATTIQRCWRRTKDRGEAREKWRREWDYQINNLLGETLGQTSLDIDKLEASLVHMLLTILAGRTLYNAADLGRLSTLARILSRVRPDDMRQRLSKDPELLLLSRRLFFAILQTLGRPNDISAANQFDIIPNLLNYINIYTSYDPTAVTMTFKDVRGRKTKTGSFYGSLSNLLRGLYEEKQLQSSIMESTLQAAVSPLNSNTSSSKVFKGFVSEFLTTPDLNSILAVGKGMTRLKHLLDVPQFVAFAGTDDEMSGLSLSSVAPEQRLHLLSSIMTYAHDDFISGKLDEKASLGYVRLLSIVMSSVAGEISRRISVEDTDMTDDEDGEQWQPLPQSVKRDVNRLKEKEFISRVFECGFSSSKSTAAERVERASFLASFAIALLFIFPADRQELRMWMCLAGTSTSEPLVKYLWQATKSTQVYQKVRTLKDSAIDAYIVESLKPAPHKKDSVEVQKENEQWRIVLLFLELYGFLLVLMDDEEFFAGGDLSQAPQLSKNKTRASALPLKDVEQLTVFLKCFAFAMHWRSSELEPIVSPGPAVADSDSTVVVGVRGMTIQYIKGVVTTLIRQLYSRDSRRRFLPEGHWLMTHRFDMEGFIPAVVLEEEHRHEIEENEEDDDDDIADVVSSPSHRTAARLQKYRENQLAQRKRNYLAPIAPRLEILQTLPFFIPFNTRVQIFREFIQVDQRRRMGEVLDPEQFGIQGPTHRGGPMVHRNLRRVRPSLPRQGGMDHELGGSRLHADIRRDHIFEDAFKSFYPIGEGLKEPMQITFLDSFGEPEAGIDGGGVTKEFLISVTKEAFTDPKPDPDSILPPTKLFQENPQHSIYPNPMSLLQLNDALDEMGLANEKREFMDTLLKKYEFLGRIVGKCLYEGILIDIAFAGSFLLKWSHRETGTNDGYKPSVNDIQDLDEELYQGLISLKNYPGNVESDLSLNFAVTLPIDESKKITIDLRPNGSHIPVTNANRLEYLHAMAYFRLQSLPERQTTAFLRGLGQIIRPTWLSMFNQSELQTLVGGDTCDLDIDDLRRNTNYSGLYEIGDDGQEHPTIQLFWDVLKNDFNEEQRRAVVKFVTSVSRAPLLGFGVLNPKFAIRDSRGSEDRLPSSSTCVNLLKLPVYKTRERLREKLLYAVMSKSGFHLS